MSDGSNISSEAASQAKERKKEEEEVQPTASTSQES